MALKTWTIPKLAYRPILSYYQFIKYSQHAAPQTSAPEVCPPKAPPPKNFSEKSVSSKADDTSKPQEKMQKFKIYRYDPDTKKKPSLQTYEIDLNE